MKNLILVFALGIILSGCYYGSSKAYVKETYSKTDAEKIIITEDDLNKPYKELGTVEAVVRKGTILNAHPTKEQVNEKLKKEASKIGADAIIKVEYKSGIGMISWGVMSGKGIAVKFQ